MTKTKTYDDGLKDGLDQALVIIGLYVATIDDGFMEVQDMGDELVKAITFAQGSVGKSVSQPAATGSQAANPGAGSIPATTASTTLQAVQSLSTSKIKPAPASLRGHNIVFTGALVSMKRIDAAQKAVAKGAHVQSKVAQNTTLIVVGSGAGSKLDSALAKNVTIIDEQTFLNLI